MAVGEVDRTVAQDREAVSEALEESARFRTNLILAEVQGAPATVKVRIFPPGSGGVPIAEAEYTLGAFEKRQVNSFMLELAGPGIYIDHETTVEWTSVKFEQCCQRRRFDRGLGRRILEEGLSFLFVPSSPRRNPNPPQYTPLNVYHRR